jgi:hypothetical protein
MNVRRKTLKSKGCTVEPGWRASVRRIYAESELELWKCKCQITQVARADQSRPSGASSGNLRSSTFREDERPVHAVKVNSDNNASTASPIRYQGIVARYRTTSEWHDCQLKRRAGAISISTRPPTPASLSKMVVSKPANLLASYMRQNISSSKVGVVVSAGKMSKAVKVRIAGQEWNKHIRKVRISNLSPQYANPSTAVV